MQKSSIWGAIFVGLFGVPFFAFGVLFIVKMSQAASQRHDPGAYLGGAFGALFACIGLGLIVLAIASYRFGQRQAATVAANPGAPWMWRDDWAAGRSDGKNSRAYIGLWIFAFLWDSISFPSAVLALPKIFAGELQLLLVMIFPIIGFVLTGVAVLATLRAKRYGRTSFWFASNPFSPGRKLSGFIHLKMPVAAEHGVDVRLSCIRQVTTGSGKSRNTVNTILWQEEHNIPGSALARLETDVQVPVELNIPADAALTNSDNPNDKLLWQLHAQADVPGVDYKDDYEIPVFRTAQQAATAQPATEGTDEGAHNRDASATARPKWDAQPVSADKAADEPIVVPQRTHIVITEDGASTEVYFPPLRNAGQALGLFAFTFIWTAVVYMLFTREAPMFFRIFFGAADVLLGVILFRVIFGSSLIRVAEGNLSIRTAIMGIGSTKTMPLDGVQSVSPVSQGQADASGEAKFGVFVQLTDGRVFKVAASSLSRTEARWIVAALDRAMGRKVETTPQFQPMMMAMPAQTSGGVVRVGGVSTSKIGRVIGIVFFLGWMMFVGRFVVHFSNSSSKKSESSQPASPEPRSIPVAVSMSEEDVSHILALPTQQQAEELLDRSIRHDERALQLFQERVDSWTSEIHQSDRMKRLEDQSRYSSDLRVRQANEDIELALDGWHKDSDAVDLLMGRAKSDPQYKPAALYFLGMEGGRGVETQHVYETLREYALHDPDPASRQWAVEGLRFLQTDEAMDTLWESFTTDPSFSVRDRAGCNISDCGVFSREQRMRFVPKLLALLDDSSLNAQMRAWCFMALREITGASLPDDVAAWSRWYSQHGSEALANFRRQPWYQVPGDQ